MRDGAGMPVIAIVKKAIMSPFRTNGDGMTAVSGYGLDGKTKVELKIGPSSDPNKITIQFKDESPIVATRDQFFAAAMFGALPDYQVTATELAKDLDLSNNFLNTVAAKGPKRPDPAVTE